MKPNTRENPFKCSFCEKQLASSGSLRAHLFTHTGFPYKCPDCSSKFAFPGELKIHLRSHTREMPFKCNVCDNKFMTNKNIKRRMKTHDTEESFNCDHCPKKYRRKDKLKEHLQIHNQNVEPLKCETCDYRTFSRWNFRQHLKFVHDSKSSALSILRCTMCFQTFKRKDALEHHIRIHTGEKPFKCKLCGKSFITSHAMKNFKKCRHKGEKGDNQEFRDSSKTFSTKLDQHRQVLRGGKPWKCSTCDKSFRRDHHLKLHIRIHTGEKPFKFQHGTLQECPMCDKSFRHDDNLKRHIGIHTGEKPFKCPKCDKSFRRDDHLKLHIQMHTEVKPFKCFMCAKSFSQDNNLKRHIRMHTGEKPFGCPVCDKSFRRDENLKRHVRLHADETPFRCSLCDKSFRRDGHLKRHIRIHAGENPPKLSLYRSRTRVRPTHVINLEKEGKFKCRFCTFSSLKNERILEHEQNDHGSDILSIVKS